MVLMFLYYNWITDNSRETWRYGIFVEWHNTCKLLLRKSTDYRINGTKGSIHLSDKGSKYWICRCVNDPKLKAVIDKDLNTHLKWLSPSAADCHERELRTMHRLFGMSVEEINEFFSFWPTRQPQWDGIAIDSKDTLYLFEAKAHPSEFKSYCRASGKRKEQIYRFMLEIQNEYYPQGNYSLWMNGYYQMANRLTFLHKLEEMTIPNINNVILVFISFANDNTHKPTSAFRLEESFYRAWEQLTGSFNPPPNVKHILVDLLENQNV